MCASRPTPIVYHCHKPRVKRTWDGPVVGLTYKSGPFNMGGPFIISDSTAGDRVTVRAHKADVLYISSYHPVFMQGCKLVSDHFRRQACIDY